MKKITIIIPVYNEEESIPYLLERLDKLIKKENKYEFEILFINDGSTDNTLKLIKENRKKNKNISYIDFARNFGKEIAMKAGIDYALGDAVVFLDADLQDPPELISEMIKYWEQGYDDVYARREKRLGEPFLKKFTSKMYYRILQSLTSVEIQKDTGDFRLLDRRCVNALKSMGESQRCSKSMFSWIGYNKKEILYVRDPRIKGKTKWNYKKLTNLAIDGITSFTTSPLRLSIYIAIPTFIAFMIYLIMFIIYLCSGNTDQNQIYFKTIIILIMFFSGIQIVLFGIVGEYLGRIFNETKNRPLYLIKEYNGDRENNKHLFDDIKEIKNEEKEKIIKEEKKEQEEKTKQKENKDIKLSNKSKKRKNGKSRKKKK